MLNAVEPGTVIPIHRHPTKDESFVVLRGKVRCTTYKDDGSVIESVVLCVEEGRYGVDIPRGVWHSLESLVPVGTVLFGTVLVKLGKVPVGTVDFDLPFGR